MTLVVVTSARNAFAASVTLNSTSGSPGTLVTATGTGWAPGEWVRVIFDQNSQQLAEVAVGGNGEFVASFAIPHGATTGYTSLSFVPVVPCPPTVCILSGTPVGFQVTVPGYPVVPPTIFNPYVPVTDPYRQLDY
jgi:hypothetical protein